jgi:phosphatidylethanolamine/phosphatidyl-N-methylethanolamine N-methyltransferase
LERALDFYQNSYASLAATGDPRNFSAKILHAALESGLRGKTFKQVLEVGANRGEHSLFVKHNFEKYTASDLVLPEGGSEYTQDQRIVFDLQNVEHLTYSDEIFDRVVSTCLFHHIPNPEKGFAELRRVTKVGGLISILLPTDPCFTYRYLRYFATVIPAKRIGKDKEIQLIHAREHRNHFYGLRTLIHHTFDSDEIKVLYPTKIRVAAANPFLVFQIVKSSTND